MKKTNIIKNLHIFRLLITITIICGAITASVLVYRSILTSLNSEFYDISCSTLDELSSLATNTISEKIDIYESDLFTISSAINYIDTKNERLEYLYERASKSDVVNFGLADTDGMLQVVGTEDYIDISDSLHYTNALNGQTYMSIQNLNLYGTDQRYVVLSRPVSQPGTDIPNGIVYLIASPDSITGSFITNPFDFQLLLCDSDNGVLAYSDYRESTTRSKPLYQLVSDMLIETELTPVNSIGNESILQYETKYGTQFIKKTTGLDGGWILYTSINNEAFSFDTSIYQHELIIVITLFIIITIIAILFYVIPVIRDRSSRIIEESRGLFIANMSHELRTPLNTIIGISEILSRSELNEGQLREVYYITDAGKSLLAMINDILDYSKLRSEKFELLLEEYDLESLVYDITTVATVRLDDRPIEFIVHIASSVPRYIIGDMARVRQIVNNIVSNAVKYTREGSISLTIDCEFIDDSNVKLIFKINDTGIGIKKENLDKLFENYSRFDAAANKNIEGTGLGLAIAKQFAELMKGDITVSSEYGQGTEFTITLIQTYNKTETLLPDASTDITETSILILEKDPILNEYYAACLEYLMLDYSITDDNYQFSSMLEDRTYNYILADTDTIHMLEQEYEKPDNTTLICLVRNTSEISGSEDTIYIPLFSLQLMSHLTGQKQSLRNYASRHSLIIYPMPEKKILVVDDNNMNLQVAMGIMEPYKMHIDVADSGQKAIEMAGLVQYDMIFMDHMMPQMDGETAMKTIRKTHPAYNNIPIIALTANAAAGAKQMFIDMGFNDFIPKPLEVPTLHDLLYRWLNPDNKEEAIKYSPQAPVLENAEEYEDSPIQFKEGLARIGSIPIYLKTLRNFCDTIPKKLESIQASFPNDINSFVIEVHGLKGVAAIVSANELANKSLELEMMGKSENTEGIAPLLPDYYEYMQEVKLCAEKFIEEHS